MDSRYRMEVSTEREAEVTKRLQNVQSCPAWTGLLSVSSCLGALPVSHDRSLIRIFPTMTSARWRKRLRNAVNKMVCDPERCRSKSKGPVPFGSEPFASDLARRPLLVHTVSGAPFTVFASRVLKHVFTLRDPRHRAYEEDPQSADGNASLGGSASSLV